MHFELQPKPVKSFVIFASAVGCLFQTGAAIPDLSKLPPAATRKVDFEKEVFPEHWAFKAPVRPALPEIKNTGWVRTPVDAFVLARLEKEGLQPSPQADKITLLRRVSLDLIGLPPTPEQVDSFLADNSPDSYEKQVERLLKSFHYGERWGRWWLDAARYADSNGYSIDAPRQIWKYRDWVINALNKDLSFDQFSIDQLAGDLLPNATIDQKIATGFNRNTQINQEGGIDPEQFRVESVIDRVNTFGSVFLGLTVGCAQCHDHKFDPLTQREYYQLFAFFNNTVEEGHGQPLAGGLLEIPNEFEPLDHTLKEMEEARADFARFLDGQGGDVNKWEQSLKEDERAKLSPQVREAIPLPWTQRSFDQKRAAYLVFRPENPDFKSRQTKLTKLEKKEPRPITTLVMQERKEPRETFVFTKGDFTRRASKVDPGVPAALHKMSCASAESTSANRLDLAKWLFDPANPLTARVIVNRIWQQYFGRGLVETENDFGTQGSLPTHPELLDWLACEFMNPSGQDQAERWSLKHIHRLIVTSAAYRQSSKARPELAVIDPGNRLLARQSRLRLDAEIVRDAALSASGLLSEEIGGPSVFPPQPDGVMTLGQLKRGWNPNAGPQRYRRALYTHFWRATPHPELVVFDAPDGFSACTRRIRSNTPLQALTLLNDQQFYEFAQALAERVAKTDCSDSARIDYAFRLCLGRLPKASERDRLAQLLPQQTNDGPGDNRTEPWTSVARVLLNLDEMITRE
jgi:hypothetical protein